MSVMNERAETHDAAALACRDLTVSYMQTPVLRAVSLTIPARKMTSISGPNGAGKTTLLKAILGLTPVDAGEILAFGEPVDRVRKRIAYVPQTESVDWDFPIRVDEVVMMGRHPHMGLFRRVTGHDREAVAHALAQVGMSEYATRHIRQLSGGQQQRVFLARALAQEADLMILDEPLKGLDAASEQIIFELVEGLVREGRTVVVVNHNLNVLDRFDWVVLLNRVVIASGPFATVATDENLRRAYGNPLAHVETAERVLREGRIDVRR